MAFQLNLTSLQKKYSMPGGFHKTNPTFKLRIRENKEVEAGFYECQ